MATPTVGRNGEIDEPTLERFTNLLIDAGVHGLFPGSSIGEFPSLTHELNHLTIETVAAAADDKTEVLAGCCDTSVEGVIENVDAADAAGADAAVVVAPYYLSTTQEGLYRFFMRVANRSTLPVLIYNIPSLTGNHLAIETVTRLVAHDNIVGLKDTSGDLTYHHRIINETPADFAVFQGATELAVASLELGASGLIAGPANVFPEAVVRLYQAHRAHENDEVRTLMQQVVMPLVTAMDDIPTAAAIKHYIRLSGLDVGKPLAPLPTLTDDERARLERAYQLVVQGAETPPVGQ